MSAVNAVALLAAAGGDYQISRSVRLRSSASAYFNRTPASAGNRKTWTLSGWAKRGALGSAQVLLSSDVGTSNSTWLELGFDAGDTLTIQGYTADIVTTAAVFRDPSAWYHIVVAFDTTQATSANRCKIYVNGTQQTLTGAGFTLNADYGINNNQIHAIGQRNWASGVGRYFDGYLTEINFIDGQALTPSSFGETDPVTGVWKPKRYAGTYGTNGFYLNFSDNSNNTAATIGKDYSGNGNNWTPNNINLTLGQNYDSMLDVPTMYADGGNGRGNYCVISPVDQTLTAEADGNLKVTTNNGGYGGAAKGSIAVSSGKWYWEWSITSNGGSAGQAPTCGITKTTNSVSSASSSSTSYGYYGYNGNKMNAGSSSSYGASFSTGNVIGVAFDADNGTLTFYKDGASQGTAFTGLSGEFCPVVWDPSTGGSIWVNFGQRPFAYTPPTGFKALNTQNLPDATIKAGNKFMDVSLWTGNGSSQSIVNSGAMQPDLVWTKGRSGASNHSLVDSVRGIALQLSSSQTAAEVSDATEITALNSNGFSVGNSSGAGYSTNANGTTYAAWQWKKGAAQGFDIVTYTGTGVSRTVSHSLGVSPKMIIVKARSTTSNWPLWHASFPSNQLYLNLTNALDTPDISSVNSSTFTLSSAGLVNGNTFTYVAYLFAEVAGYSKFGSYTGNGAANGPFVHCGFRPRFILRKRTDAAWRWFTIDSSRDANNVANSGLFPNYSNAEEVSTTNWGVDLLSNGFKIRSTDVESNASGGTYIYAAFAENPFKNSLAR